jgi:hypothetical protein
MAKAISFQEVHFHTAETRRGMKKVFEKLGSKFPKSDDAFDRLFDK